MKLKYFLYEIIDFFNLSIHVMSNIVETRGALWHPGEEMLMEKDKRRNVGLKTNLNHFIEEKN